MLAQTLTIVLSLTTTVHTFQWPSAYRTLSSSLLLSEHQPQYHKSSVPTKHSYRAREHSSDHHHWSVDDWWNNVQDDDRRSLAQLSLSPRDFEAFVAVNDDNDPLEMAASENQARIVEEPEDNNGKLRHDGRSVIVDINEHSHRIENNKSSIVSRRKPPIGNDGK